MSVLRLVSKNRAAYRFESLFYGSKAGRRRS